MGKPGGLQTVMMTAGGQQITLQQQPGQTIIRQAMATNPTRLEELCDPASHTKDRLDCRLGWFFWILVSQFLQTDQKSSRIASRVISRLQKLKKYVTAVQ